MANKSLQPIVNYLHQAAHTEDGWITPLRNVVSDVSPDEAALKPAADVASIHELIAHATPYLYDVLRALRGEDRVQHEDWPYVAGPEDWVGLRGELVAGIDQLGAEIAKLSDEELLEASPNRETPRWEVIVDIAVHDAYHAGQVVKLRQLHAAQGAREAAGV
ncbi:MAG: hypothetical protein QOJ65_2836 [Fimbriimonadaceae bacterium]|jgi:uncharacterized damage-inducible protein DinB|nr:hypothetical protein [Fimbriimonadaceae bacterium]